MSLVGPRPCLLYEAKEYLPWQTRRFDVSPGMTGLWEVTGKNKTTFKEMIRLELSYVKTFHCGSTAQFSCAPSLWSSRRCVS